MNDTTVTPEELPVSAPAVSEQPDPAKELETVRTGTVSVRTEDYTENLLFAEEIGKVKASRAVASALDLSVVRWFDFMKNSKAYKGKQFIGPDNKPFLAENFEQFCEGMGFSYDKIYHDIQNLSTFGEERLTEIRNLGLTVRDTRKIRKAIKDVDEDTKKEIFRELKSSTPEDLRVTIDVICAQHAKAQADNKKLEKEAEKLKEKVETLEKDKEAQQKVAQERNDQIAALKEELIVATSSAIADVEVKKMKKNAKNREIIDEKCRDALRRSVRRFSPTMKIRKRRRPMSTSGFLPPCGAWPRIFSPPGSTWTLLRSLCRTSARMWMGNRSSKRTIRKRPTRGLPCLPHLQPNSFAS